MSSGRNWIGLAMILSACTDAPARKDGSTRIDVAEAGDTSTVIAYSGGREVGRLELFHGRFTLSDMFAEGYDDRSVVGRKLEVRVGDQVMAWETEGFFPTMGLPAHPAELRAMADFLQTDEVKQLLVSWGIAFQASGADAGYTAILNGTNPCECSGQLSCPTMFGQTPGACAGSGAPVAFIVHQRAAPGYQTLEPSDTIYDQSFIVQCCPGNGDLLPILARKSCGDAGRGSFGTCGQAGATALCRACPTYSSNGKCKIAVTAAGWSDPGAPTTAASYCGGVRSDDEQRTVYDVSARWSWTCGDGICDTDDEDCASCAADCGCSGVDSCGGGGTAGQCGCTPQAACPDGYQCGSIDDGCGGTVDCSGGQTCDAIMGKKHYECVADSHLCCKHGRCHEQD